MKKHVRKVRKHIDSSKHEMLALSLIAIVVSFLYIVTQTRERFIVPLLSNTRNDLVVRAIYFDRANDPGLYFSLGNYYFGEGPVYDLQKAKKYFTKTLSLDESYERGNYQLSRVYFVEGNQAEALKYIDREIVHYPDFGRSHYIRGLVNGYSNRLPEAVIDFKKFIEWKPETWAGYNDLAWVYFQQGDFRSAYSAAQKGLQYSPNNPWLLNTVGISLKNMGNEAGAKKAFLEARTSVSNLSAENWGKAYPGNDPDFYEKGFENMKKTIDNNISLLE